MSGLSGGAGAGHDAADAAERQIAELEQDLGTALFIRSQRGLLPTDAAADIAPHAEAMAAASGAMMRAARRHRRCRWRRAHYRE